MNKNTQLVKKIESVKEVHSELFDTLLEEATVRIAMTLMRNDIEAMQRLDGQINSWGSQEGFIRVRGKRVSVSKLRARNLDTKQEIKLESYKQMQSKKKWSADITQLSLGGLASRQFDKLGEILGNQYGLSKSQVSTHVVPGLKRYYDELMETDCSDVVALMLDGIHFGKKGEHVVIGALGITGDGHKKLLGIWAGGTENSSVVGSLINDLIKRGLKKPQLTLLDGSKALKKAILEQWEDALVGRCQQHKLRNVVDHLVKSKRDWARKKFNEVINAPDYETGETLAAKFSAELKSINQSACNSFQEGLPEILVPLLIEDKNLRRFFSTTNAMESMFSTIRSKTGRVKRWRHANSVLYWVATGYAQQKKNLNRIRGYEAIGELAKLAERFKAIQKDKVVGFKKETKSAGLERQVA